MQIPLHPGMRCFLIAAAATGLFFAAGIEAQSSGEWTWVNGPSALPASSIVPAVYGVEGTPSPQNTPGGRSQGATWTDLEGHLWLFGGYFVNGSSFYELNDMWEYDPATNEWTWWGGNVKPPCQVIDGNPMCGQSGVYGHQGSASASNQPGGRYSTAAWADASGNLWMYGGFGFDSVGTWGTLNDLWEFNPQTHLWTWINGDATIPSTGSGDPGTWGTQGIAAAGNNPGALVYAYRWTDTDGNGWAFGGWGFDSQGSNGMPNDLWKFDSSEQEWAWMNGPNPFYPPWIQPSVYGSMGTPASGNIPGSRSSGAAWVDSNGNLWLFGGLGYDSQGNSGYLNELWEYRPATGEWAWMAGQDLMQCAADANKQNCGNAGVYGAQGVPGAANLPGGRTDAVYWTDRMGNFWLFGGAGFNSQGNFTSLNDLWEFNPALKEWMWVGGNSNSGPESITYGTKGLPAPGNWPGARPWAMAWTGNDGSLWLYGGEAFDANANLGYLNDLWRYQPSAAGFPQPDFSVGATPSALTVQAGQSASVTVTVTPQNGFNAVVTFACSGLPAGATCSFSPANVTPTGGAASTTLTLQASASASAAPGSRPGTLAPGAMLAMACLSLISKRQRQVIAAIVAFAFLGFGILLSGCTSAKAHAVTNPPENATVTVTATAGTLAHSTVLAVTVN